MWKLDPAGGEDERGKSTGHEKTPKSTKARAEAIEAGRIKNPLNPDRSVGVRNS